MKCFFSFTMQIALSSISNPFKMSSDCWVPPGKFEKDSPTNKFEIFSYHNFFESELFIMSTRSSRSSKAKLTKLQVVEEMKNQREKAKEAGSALAAFDLEEDEDVFETLDEAEYESVVEKRRAAGDFVVDDGKY